MRKLTLDEVCALKHDDPGVIDVVCSAVQSGEAWVYEQDGELFYHDPYFSGEKEHPVRLLRYSQRNWFICEIDFRDGV